MLESWAPLPGFFTVRKSIEQDTLQTLIETGALRECRAIRQGDAWALQGRIGMHWLPVRSRREPVRRWASLTALGRFCEKVGIRAFLVEL